MDPLVPVYPLADIDANGKSVTTVPDVTLADVTADPFVINVHDSLAELPVIVSCGNVPVSGEGGGAAVATLEATGVGGGTPGDIPAAGVGSAIGMDNSNSAVLIALGVLAVVLAVAGFFCAAWKAARIPGEMPRYRLKVRVPFLSRTAQD